ncbi:calcium/sodium antiporter [Patescibacteria group bacterium]
MQLLFWILIFIISLAVLMKGADYFIDASEKIGKFLRLSPFLIGVTIVAMGTTLPELSTSLIATFNGQTEIVTATAIGSCIANILLILGIASLVVGTLSVERSLIELDLPLLSLSTALVVIVAFDKQIVRGEGIILIIAYLIYMFYNMQSRKEHLDLWQKGGEFQKKHIFLLFFSLIAVFLGAKFSVSSLVNIAEIVHIPSAVAAITVLAIGTSLPELVVVIKEVMKNQHETAVGDVLGANIMNSLLVIGLPALFVNLTISEDVFRIGLPFLIGVTLLYIISGISKKVYKWEGAMYLLIYILFIGKLFKLF